MEKNNEGDLRVWWIPQVPMKPFYVDVSSVDEARKILDVLGDYDAFQFAFNVKGGSSSAGGLQVFRDWRWVEWSDRMGNSVNDLEYKVLCAPETHLALPDGNKTMKVRVTKNAPGDLYKRDDPIHFLNGIRVGAVIEVYANIDGNGDYTMVKTDDLGWPYINHGQCEVVG